MIRWSHSAYFARMYTKALRNLFLAASIFPAITLHAQVWLDPTFGNGGVVSISLASSLDAATCMALQPDGKIVVGGTYASTPDHADFLVARYEADGSLDPDFGNGGWNILDHGLYDVVNDLALQPDGGIILVGTTQGAGTDKVMMRFTTSGQLDPTFNGTGFLIIDDSFQEDQLNGVAVQSDGKIVAVGQGFDGSKDVFYICRLNADGAFDTSFGGTGEVEHTISGDNCRAHDVAIMPDGRIVSVGTSYSDATTKFDAVAVCYLADGTLDNSFDGDGKAIFVWSFLDDIALAVVVQPDGKVVMGGTESEAGPNTRVTVSRMNADGGHDLDFGANGTMRTWTGIAATRCGALALDADGRIIVAGAAAASGVARRSYVCRLAAEDGALDPDFGSGGELFHPEIGPNEETPSVAVQPDGRIVVAGSGGAGISIDVRLLRYLETPFTGIADAPNTAPMRLLHADASGADVILTSSSTLTCQVVDVKGTIVAAPATRGPAAGIRRIDFGATLAVGAYVLVAGTDAGSVSMPFVVVP